MLHLSIYMKENRRKKNISIKVTKRADLYIKIHSISNNHTISLNILV